MLRTIRTYRSISTPDRIAIASAAVATVVAVATDRLPALIIGLAVVACQWAIFLRNVDRTIELGQQIERDAQNRRRIEGYQLLREIQRDP